MRRFLVPVLILFTATVGFAPRLITALQAAENAPTEAKEDAKEKKESDAAKKETAKSDAESKKAKTEAKDAEKSEKKDKEKASAEGAKDKAAKSEEKSTAKAEKKAAAKEEPKKRKTHKVEAKRLKIDVPLDGTFVPRKMDEIQFKPKAWTEYEIVEVADLGSKVHKGETLFKFDDIKINEAIADLELDQRVNDLAITKAEEELPRMEKTLKLDFEDATRSNKHAQEDLKRYNEIDRPMALKTAQVMLKYYNFMLDYEKDELKELEKMYKADDLTEATEEIVLKRQRNKVEFAEFSFQSAKLETEEMVKVRIPRMDVAIKEAVDRAALAKARAQMALSLDLNRARYELEQRKKLRTKSVDRHTKLLADKELMEIKSPADGIVFYGQQQNGRWSETPSMITRYKPKNNVMGGSVLMTIVESRPLYITSTFDEGKRPEIANAEKVKVSLPAEGHDRLSGDVKSISPIEVSPGKFEITFDVKQEQIPKWVVPGMSCKVQVTTYDKKDALAVPKKAVHDDKDDPDQHYVWLVKADDEEAKPERRNVKLGKRKDEDVEVLKGLKKGDVISLDDEEAKEKEKADKEKKD
jgi:HlyD family secretion protein